MAQKLHQGLHQTQTLAMTPQLQQAIKLLTLTHLEMTNVIAQEMVENPMLEEMSAGDNEGASSNETDYQAERLEAQNQEVKAGDFDEAPMVQKDDFDFQAYVEAYNSTSSTPNMATRDASEEAPNYENMVSKSMTLAEHLEWQLMMDELSDDEKKIAHLIIHNINDDGYLEVSFDEIVESSGVERAICQDVLESIQSLDPVGCGSTDLVECLLAQARIAEERSPLLEKIIRNHLEDLRHNDFEKISKATGVDKDRIKETALLLQNFHPKPGRLVSPGETHYIVPDIFIVEVAGEFVVQVNDEGVPRLRISQMYQNLLNANTAKNDPTREFVQDKLRAAMWLIKSIQNRQQTIYKTAKAIVRQQQEFFKKGPKYLKPMILKNVAEEIGMHESTVSRVTTNKYMHTPIGTFELKYFFNTGVGGKDGGIDVSSEVLRMRIKEMIENESPKKPLSDQKIAELLSRDEVNIARRTVAKYREAMGIASSAIRKRKD